MSDELDYGRSLSLLGIFLVDGGSWIYEIVNFGSDLSQSGLDLR